MISDGLDVMVDEIVKLRRLWSLGSSEVKGRTGVFYVVDRRTPLEVEMFY
jgi:hypothetical protein